VRTLSVTASRAWLEPGRAVENAHVECGGGVVTYAGPAPPPAPSAGRDAERLHLDGFLMPAAADRHVHIELSDPAAVLRGGVTAVRDLAWPPQRIFPLADLSELPSFDGPLIKAAGPMLTGAGGYPVGDRWAPPGTGLEVRGRDDAVAAVRRLHEQGAVAVKVSLNADAPPTVDDAELMAICDTAHGLGTVVTAHCQGRGQVERALGADVDELAHTPWTEPLPDDVVRQCAARLRIVSTLDIHARGRNASALRVATDNLRRFHDAGGTVVYGTDLGNGQIPAGIDVPELRLMVDAGLTIEELLAALTRAPLRPGAPADLVGLGSDPFADIAAFADIRLVVRAGVVVRR
jgi:imidazolonepropionase-like amidohydrolase